MDPDRWFPRPWQLPLIVAALIVPTFLGFAIGGAGLGTSIGALTLATLIIVAARSQTRGAIRFEGRPEGQPVLVLALAAVDDATTANAVAALAEPGASGREPGSHDVLVLAPATSPALQRWLSATDEARLAAQERLAISLATLAAAGCHAEGRVVDDDPVQAIEDVAAQYGAEQLAVVVGGERHDRVVSELRDRIDRPLRRIEVSG